MDMVLMLGPVIQISTPTELCVDENPNWILQRSDDRMATSVDVDGQFCMDGGCISTGAWLVTLISSCSFIYYVKCKIHNIPMNNRIINL